MPVNVCLVSELLFTFNVVILCHLIHIILYFTLKFLFERFNFIFQKRIRKVEEALNIECLMATKECRFILKRIRYMIIAYRQSILFLAEKMNRP